MIYTREQLREEMRKIVTTRCDIESILDKLADLIATLDEP